VSNIDVDDATSVGILPEDKLRFNAMDVSPQNNGAVDELGGEAVVGL
jgi:hypothetical protein